MRFLISGVCLVLMSTFIKLEPAYSRQTERRHADSLRQVLYTATDYDEQIRLLGELSDYYSYSDSAKAMGYALRIKELAKNQGDQRGLGIAHYRIGGVYYERVQADSAIKEYETAIRLLENDTSFLGRQTLAKAWYNYGAQYQQKGDEETFLDIILNRSNPIYEAIGDTLGTGRSLHNIGLIFQNNREYDRAIFYYEKAISALKPYPGTPELIDSYCKMVEAIIYDSDIARNTNINPSLRAAVVGALNEADSLLRSYPDNYSRILYMNSLGIFEEVVEKRLDTALSYYLQGYESAKAAGFDRLGMILLNRAYYIYDKQERHQLALETARYLLKTAENDPVARNKLIQLRNVMNSLEKLGNIREAYEIQKQYSTLSDSLYEVEMAFKVHNLEQKYEAKEKEARIIQLNQQMQEQALRAQRNRLLTFLLTGAVMLVVSVSAAGYIIFRKKQLIAKQQAELLEQNLEKMGQEQHISVFAAMLEGQEQERKRLAIDLHDGLGGSLSSIKMKLSKVVQTGNGAVANSELPVVVSQLDASVDELRRIARNMMPETLMKFGLAAALRDFCKGLESEAIKISFQAYGLRNNDIPQNIQIMVYRIIQELVTNAARHAQANHILVQCLQDDNLLSITVEDDGKGFGAEQRESSPGMGLSNVRNRIAYLGGRLDIQSEPDVGTTVTIELTYDDE